MEEKSVNKFVLKSGIEYLDEIRLSREEAQESQADASQREPMQADVNRRKPMANVSQIWANTIRHKKGKMSPEKRSKNGLSKDRCKKMQTNK